MENKLLNYHAQAKKRRDALKKSLEEEEMKEVQAKPKINKKSRILAEIYEKKYFQQLTEPKEPQKPSNTQNVTLSYTPEALKVPIKLSVSKKITVNSYNFFQKNQVPIKKRTKSLLNLSVLERNEVWLAKKNEKLDRSRLINQEKTLAECTFSPVTVNKAQASKHLPESSENSFVSTPLSVETFTDCSENQLKSAKKPQGYKALAPFQVKVSFRCGIDLRSFLKRAK